MFHRNRQRRLQPKVISRFPKFALRIFFANKTGWRYLKYDCVTGGFTNKTAFERSIYPNGYKFLTVSTKPNKKQNQMTN
jgi:hypothetical protein